MALKLDVSGRMLLGANPMAVVLESAWFRLACWELFDFKVFLSRNLSKRS